MNAWLAWLAMALSAGLLVLVVVLLFRVVARSRADSRLKVAADARFVPTTPDETMIISREQADEMLNK